jgi:mxaL protein
MKARAVLARMRAVSPRAFDRNSLLIILAAVLLVASALLPRLNLPRNTYDYVVVFDISQSMGVDDYELDAAAVTRLDYAKAATRAALRDLPCGSRVGWAVFAEYRSLLLLSPIEVCKNYNDLLASLANIDGRMRWGNASEITKGVYWAMRAVKATSDNPSLVFITDGQEAPPLDPAQPPEIFADLKRGEASGWIIGAGGDIPRRIPKVDDEGRRIGYWKSYEVLQRFGGSPNDAPGTQPREHLSSLREGHLRQLAQDVGLGYQRLTDLQVMSQAMRDARLARRTPQRTDVGWIAATLALLLLVIRFRPSFAAGSPQSPGGADRRTWIESAGIPAARRLRASRFPFATGVRAHPRPPAHEGSTASASPAASGR